MTTHPNAPIESAATSEGVDDAQFALVQRDTTFGGRATLAGQYLAGLSAAAQVASVGSPVKLPRDLFPAWPDADPALIQAVWDRALVVGVHLERMMKNPDRYRAGIEEIRGVLDAAGYAAMAGMVRRSLAMTVPAHPADAESGGRGHDDA